jgi:quercetin dioxygenase-like cupin family protein
MHVEPGAELTNPVTGERGIVRVAPSDANGQTLVADLFVRPRGAVIGEHVHPAIEEVFTVVRGRIEMRIGGRLRLATAGDRVAIAPGTAHDWWNAGDEEAHVVVEVRPGGRFLEGICNSFGLAQDGKTDAKGMPHFLQLVLFAKEFEDVLIFTALPRWAVATAYRILGPVARWRGYRSSYPEYLARLVPPGSGAKLTRSAAP